MYFKGPMFLFFDNLISKKIFGFFFVYERFVIFVYRQKFVAERVVKKVFFCENLCKTEIEVLFDFSLETVQKKEVIFLEAVWPRQVVLSDFRIFDRAVVHELFHLTFAIV